MRRIVPVILCGAVMALAVALLLCRTGSEDLEPLANITPPGRPAVGLPENTVVLHVKNAESINPPFALREDVTAVDGVALTIPDGGGSPENRGQATVAFDVSPPGRYTAWARARWQDSCGNSVSLKVDNSPSHTVGQDAVYNTWHWVNAGQHVLEGGKHKTTVTEREDGVALDQVLFTPDENFMPAGPILPGGEGMGVRRFADAFDRSPGHKMEAWDLASGKWNIEFSLDPNRIPNQYSLVGEAGEGEAVALIKGPPWRGCRLSFSVLPLREGRFGAVLDRASDGSRALRVGIDLGGKGARLASSGADPEQSADLDDRIRLNQWHRILVERWGWTLRVLVDGREALTSFDAAPHTGGIGLFVASGAAVFDDVDVEETPWVGEDGREFRIPWSVDKNAEWYRSKVGGLVGRRGAITAQGSGLSVEEIHINESAADGETCTVEAPGLQPAESKGASRMYRCSNAGSSAASAVRLTATGREAWIRRVAIRYGQPLPDLFLIGPYHFTETEVEDPSDYLDFTPEEYKQIEGSPEAEKLRRRKKHNPLVGAKGCKSVWIQESGRWRIENGALVGAGPNAVLAYSQEIVSDLEFHARIKMDQPGSAAEFVFCSDKKAGVCVRVGGKGEGALHVPMEPDGKWHALAVSVAGNALAASVDGRAARRKEIARGEGGTVLLKAPAGAVQFDDIEFWLSRKDRRGAFYAFDRRETDWWRDGGPWMDHGGIACILASNWVSLIAPDGEGTLWNKRSFGPDVLVAFDIEENTEWFGWDRKPSHVHHPFDNIRILFASENNPEQGYRLEVNSRNRTATAFYRNGKEVASVRQDKRFPIQYGGGHSPYTPRKNRISLSKRGGDLRAVVNGAEVLRFTDPQPISAAKVGIGGCRTRANFSHIEVRTLCEKDKAG